MSKNTLFTHHNFTHEISLSCLKCGKQLKSLTGLANHCRNTHKINYKDYLLEYYDIDTDKLDKEWMSDEQVKSRKERKIKGLINYAKSIKGKQRQFTEEQYVSFKKNMKGVFSKDWFIKKYGYEVGIKKYEDRSIKISKSSFFKIYNTKNKENWSKISQELFWEIYKRIKKNFKFVYFGELNHEYGCETNMNFDFVVVDNKKIIEFNGDKFHANPKIYTDEQVPIKFMNKCAKDIWIDDLNKHEKAIKNGYKIMVVWESDYNDNKEKIILNCLDFLYE